ncbi:MAG: hypothetical protein ACT4QG_21500 [Sporichthyaceae bacterium]
MNNTEIENEAHVALGSIPAQRGTALTPRHKDEEFLNLVAVGFLAAGDVLVHPFDGETVVLRADGSVEFADGTWLASPTAALNAGAPGRNGWKAWHHERSGRTLADLHVAARNFVV